MHKYIGKRLLQLILVAVGVSFLIYFIMDIAPGDLALTALGEGATQAEYEAFREENGLNKPLIHRYANYMWGLLHGDMGYSYKFKMDAMTLYMQRLPATILLAVSSMIVGTIMSIPLGIYAALRQGSLQDNAVSALAMFGIASPNFWVGLMLIILFSLHLGWFNSGGFESWKDLILPACTIGVDHMASMVRTTRSGMIDVLRQDYLMLARAKGVKEKKVISKHALRNALIPIITIMGMQVSKSLGGSVITETVFSWPGVGRLVVDAIKSQDVELVTGSIIITSIIASGIILAVDILYAFIDPRIKARYSK